MCADSSGPCPRAQYPPLCGRDPAGGGHRRAGRLLARGRSDREGARPRAQARRGPVRRLGSEAVQGQLPGRSAEESRGKGEKGPGPLAHEGHAREARAPQRRDHRPCDAAQTQPRGEASQSVRPCCGASIGTPQPYATHRYAAPRLTRRLGDSLWSDTPDGVAHVVRHEQRARPVGGDADGTTLRVAVFVEKAAQDFLERTRRLAGRERYERHAVAQLRLAIPGPVLTNERTPVIANG